MGVWVWVWVLVLGEGYVFGFEVGLVGRWIAECWLGYSVSTCRTLAFARSIESTVQSSLLLL